MHTVKNTTAQQAERQCNSQTWKSESVLLIIMFITAQKLINDHECTTST